MEEEEETKEKKKKNDEEEEEEEEEEDQRLIANNRRETHQNAPHIRGRDDSSLSSSSSSSSVFGVLESATKMVCFGILALFVAKAVYANVVHPLVSLSNADYTLKTVVRDVFYGYEKPRTVKTAASSVRDIEREKKRLADETHLKRKLEHREKKRKKLHEKLGLNHEEEVENWRRKSEKREKKRSTGSAHGEL